MTRVSAVYAGLLCILLWLTFMHVTTLIGFGEGYLKTRPHLEKKSECVDVKALYTLPNRGYVDGLGQQAACWNRRRFEHVVVLLIDSLRFDFCVMDPTYNESVSQLEGHAFIDPGDQANIIRYYKNRLPVINETIWTQPTNSRLFRFIADPPTATMQRIKALTTGSMPTFLEVGDNFASEAIHDDNWVSQMARAGRKAIFMGDDTWLSMYPTSFAKTYPYPSFEVRDLHTVDLGVQKHLIPEIHGESFGPSDWHLILGHMLGVDHVGHRLGSNHPEMASKLTEMNYVIKQVMSAVNEDTLFVMLSDHGMNYEGNHGGATAPETSASLFFYSPKRGVFSQPLSVPLPNSERPFSYYDISQIDIVPTLSMLLGAPIPFGSLGMIVPDLFWDADRPDDLLDPLHVNTAQLMRYLSELEKSDNRFPSEEMKTLRELFDQVVGAHANWQTSDDRSVEHAKKIVDLYRNFHDQAVDMCRRLWTTFDTDKMTLNAILLLATALVPGLLALAKPRSVHRVLYYVGMGLFWAPLTWLVGWKSQGWPSSVELLLFVAQVGSLASFALAILREFDIFYPDVPLTPRAMRAWYRSLKMRPDSEAVVAGFAFLGVFTLRCLSVASNSFIIHAQSTGAYVVSSLIALLAYTSYRNGKARVALALLVALVLNRLTYHTFAGGHENYFMTSTYVDLVVHTVLPMLAIAIATLVVVRRWLNSSLALLFVFLLPQLLVAVYWMVQSFGLIDQFQAVRIYLPWTIYASSIVQVLYLMIFPFFKPSSVFAMPSENYKSESTDGGQTDFSESGDGRHVTVMSVKFLTRANFARAVLGLLPTILLVLGPASPLPIFLLLFTGISIVSSAITSLNTTPKPSRAILALLAVLWSYLAYAYFYATSHLPVFNALQMSAAFVGIDGFSLIFGGLLVLFNAMFSHFALAISAPILGCNLFHFDEGAIQKVILIYNFIYSSAMVATCAASYVLRRHLFVWTVFAPFFLFEGMALITVDIGLLIGTMIAFASSRQTAPKRVLSPKARRKCCS